jgi:hypothetical protein
MHIETEAVAIGVIAELAQNELVKSLAIDGSVTQSKIEIFRCPRSFAPTDLKRCAALEYPGSRACQIKPHEQALEDGSPTEPIEAHPFVACRDPKSH